MPRAVRATCERERLWITGVAGFIGRAVLAEARRRSSHLHISGIGRGLGTLDGSLKTALDVGMPGTMSSDKLDQLASLAGAPTRVIHLAASSSVGRSFEGPGEDFQRTVDGSACLFHWLGRHAPQARVVLASSAAVYGAGCEGAIPEDSQCAPTSPYGWHKKIVEDLGECETQTSGLRVLPARIFSAYGPGLRKQLFWDVAEKLSENVEFVRLMGTGEEVRDWCYVNDVAKVLIELVESAQAFNTPMRAVNISSGRGISVETAVRDFCAAFLGQQRRLPKLCFSHEQRVGDPKSLVGATQRLDELGLVSPRTFPAELRNTAAWCRKEVQYDTCRVHPSLRYHLDGRPNISFQSCIQFS